jgi:hypothetical protein
MNTNDTFSTLQEHLPKIPLEDYRRDYTELARRVTAEGTEPITPEVMHSLILSAHNEQTK